MTTIDFPVDCPVRLVRNHGEPIPRDEQLHGIVASEPSDNGEVQVTFMHDGEPAFDFWPVDELEVDR